MTQLQRLYETADGLGLDPPLSRLTREINKI